MPAHLTLFHALPGDQAVQIARELGAICRSRKAFELTATGPRSLGRGVAIGFAAPELVSLRQVLAREWRDWLTPQDSAKIAPHVTVQNKVSPQDARKLLAELQAGFAPFTMRAEGLDLWRYLGGPWRHERLFRFEG